MSDISSQLSPRRLPKPGHFVPSAISVSPSSETRRVWSPQKQKRFVDALIHLGVQNATPESIVKQMNVEGLNQENVATHLQRYKFYWKRSRPELPLYEHGKEIKEQLLDDVGLGTLEPHRLIWDVLLHRTFVEVLAQLGIDYATPEKILQMMNVKDLALQDVVSHMQRYRPYLMGLGKDISAAAMLEQQKEEKLTISSQLEATSVPVLEDHVFFHKVLAQRDVSALDLFSIPKEHAEKYFPSLIKEEVLLLNFEDPIGKLWQFRYSHWTSNHSFALSGGWIDFVKEKDLIAGDTVSFGQKAVDIGENKFFIRWSHEADDVESALPFDDMILEDALLYCALFSFDFEFEKDTLLQLWMAVGIFVKEPTEEIAALFFDDCLAQGYFQVGRTNLVTGKVNYKFKSDSHLLPLLISRGNHIVQTEGISNLKDISPEVTHMSMGCCSLNNSASLHELKRFKQLRTLMFLQGHQLGFKQIPRDFFLSLNMLQVLDLCHTCLTELPSSVGNMKFLHYLSLSETPIKYLPESIGCLKNLQTLKLRGCSNLSTLPKGIRKLINLRHLDFDILRQLRSMPQGMGALTSIRTLSAFLIGVEEECSIRQLKYMNNLSGSICISQLENVFTDDEAVEACLSNKSHITKLELHWTESQDENTVGYGKVLSSLEPYRGLEQLCISCYGGLELPSWICDPTFYRLVSITLFNCENCLVLPSLGKLPSLKFLNIVDFHKLKVIDHNFYGGLSIHGYIAFPKLEKLTVENMLSLEAWSGIKSSDFPHLLNLRVKHCPKLYSLCTLSCLCSLEKLEIIHCAMLASCPDSKLPARVEAFIIEDCPLISAGLLNDDSRDWIKVAHIPHLWIDHREISFGPRYSQEYVSFFECVYLLKSISSLCSMFLPLFRSKRCPLFVPVTTFITNVGITNIRSTSELSSTEDVDEILP